MNITRVAGRARTLELILGGELVGAELAERYGLINRALPADELDGFVDTLARRIAGLRPKVIAVIKRAVDTVAPPIPQSAYATEHEGLVTTADAEVVELAGRLLAAGIQTCEGEREHERILYSM